MDHERSASELAHANAVRTMFSGIAARYDLLNHLLSANIDKRWRKRVRELLVDVLADPRALILDVACGTGDLSIELQRGAEARVFGTDFCRPMLERAGVKTENVGLALPLIEADAMQLSFADSGFDAVTIAFGLRNLSNFRDGLAELRRILKPGGRVVVLEFSSPAIPGFRSLFNFYFAQILPRIGGLLSGSRGAYEYLPNSVAKFPKQADLAKIMEQAGFEQVKFENLTGGIAATHTGTRKC